MSTAIVAIPPVAVLPRPTRDHLPAGALDRLLLTRSLTFALTSARAGFVESNGFGGVNAYPGLVGGVFWNQSEWLLLRGSVPAVDRAVTLAVDAGAPLNRIAEWDDEECGTGCCIAGWIATAAGHPAGFDDKEVHTPGLLARIGGRAIFLLTGINELDLWGDGTAVHYPGLPEGRSAVRVHDLLAFRLFHAANTLDKLVDVADELLEYYGQGPLTVDADGVFH